jgi:serine/threonine-protein kinase RsbW
MKVPKEFGVGDDALIEVVVPNDLHRAREAEETILAAVGACGYDPDAVFGIKLSLEEALTNAVRHGNAGDPDKTVTIRYFVDAERVVVMVRDEGNGFRPEAVPDPTADENLERPSGRELMLMQSYMSQVTYSPRGNEVWMLKLNRPAPQ